MVHLSLLTLDAKIIKLDGNTSDRLSSYSTSLFPNMDDDSENEVNSEIENEVEKEEEAERVRKSRSRISTQDPGKCKDVFMSCKFFGRFIIF